MTYPAQLGLYFVSALMWVSMRNGGAGALPFQLLISVRQTASAAGLAGRGGNPYSASRALLAEYGRNPFGGEYVLTILPFMLYSYTEPPPARFLAARRGKVL